MRRRVAELAAAIALTAAAATSGARAQDVSWRERPGGEGPSDRRAAQEPRRVPAAERRPEVEPLAIVGADVYPVTGPAVPRATLLLEGGRIRAILPEGHRRRLPRGVRRVDATGLRAYPGLVAAGADALGLSPDVRVGAATDALGRRLVDSYDPLSEGLAWASSAGITTALVYSLPFGGNSPIAGRGEVLKVSPRHPEGVLVKAPAAGFAAPSLLTAEGRHRLRKLVEDAREWRATPRSKRKPDPAKELVLDLVDGRLPLFVTPGSPGAVTAALDLAEELGLHLVVYQSSDAWALADELARARVDVVQHVRTNWWKPRGSRRARLGGGWRPDAAALLVRAGVRVAVVPQLDAIVTWGVAGRDLTNLPMEAAFAQRGGLTADRALAAITIEPARMLGVDDRVGSLEVGKDADVILTTGDPLDYRTVVLTTIVDGRVVHEGATHPTFRGIVAPAAGAAAP